MGLFICTILPCFCTHCFFCKLQNLRLVRHSAEKIRTQRIFCCLSLGLLGRRHLLLRHIWQFSKKSYISLISWSRYLSSRDIIWALRTRSGILYFEAAASHKQKTCGCSARAAAMPRWRNYSETREEFDQTRSVVLGSAGRERDKEPVEPSSPRDKAWVRYPASPHPPSPRHRLCPDLGTS